MIRFFTNYSYGGYEELYLGNFNDKEEYRYYLPLLPVKQAKLVENPSDEKLKAEVERLLSYPLIQKHGNSSEAMLPEGSFTLISNPGYKVIYRRLGNSYIVSVSDIVGNDHDEMGGGQRGNPFTMLFVGEQEDYPVLDAIVWQMLKNEEEMRMFLGGLFSYDATANGLRFSLKELIEKLNTLKDIKVYGVKYEKDVPFMILSKGFTLNYTLEIQKLQHASLGSIYNDGGVLVRGTRISTEAPRKQEEPNKKEEEVTEFPKDIDKDTEDKNREEQQKDNSPVFQRLTKKEIIILACSLIGALILGALLCKHH